MPNKLSVHVKTAFVMTAEVEKAEGSPSGYRCAETQWSTANSTKLPLFGDLRFRGVAAMTRLGFADRVVIIGGVEDRYPGEHISRAAAFKAILEADFDAVGPIVAHVQSGTTTSVDAYGVMSAAIGNGDPENYAVVSSKYHLARIEAQMGGVGLRLVQRWPAEAFLLAEDPASIHQLFERFGSNGYAQREARELRGIADILTGSYKPLPAKG